MRFIARLCLAFVLLPTAASITVTLPAAAQGAPKRSPSIGQPPQGGDALYAWCRHVVFNKYGQRGVREKAVVMIDAGQIEPMIDYCVQNKGRSY